MRYFAPHKLKQITKNWDNESREIALEFAELKDKYISIALQKLKLDNSFNQNSFERQLLESLGFHPCVHCTKSTTMLQDALQHVLDKNVKMPKKQINFK